LGLPSTKKEKNGKGLLNTALGTPNYAAPELHLNQPYFGVANDLFSVAVAIFVLITGAMPFKAATAKDQLYNYFIKNDYDGYWIKRNLKVPLSANFKNLFQNMIAFDPSQRPSMDEIKMHPWLQELKTKDVEKLKESLQEDFKKRKMIVDFKRKKEKAVKEETKGKVKTPYAYRSGNKSGKDGKQINIDSNLNLIDYAENDNPYVIVYPKDTDFVCLAETLTRFFNDKYQAEAGIEKDKAKFVVEVEPEVGDEQLDELFVNTNEILKFTYEIKRYVDDQLIVDFKRKEGDRLRFHTLFQKLC